MNIKKLETKIEGLKTKFLAELDKIKKEYDCNKPNNVYEVSINSFPKSGDDVVEILTNGELEYYQYNESDVDHRLKKKYGHLFDQSLDTNEYLQAKYWHNILRVLADYKTSLEIPDNYYSIRYVKYGSTFEVVFNCGTIGTFGFSSEENTEEAIELIGEANLKLIVKYGFGL